jgi:hypothetical protein
MLQILLLQSGDSDGLVGAAMSRAPEELVGHVNRLQRSLLFTYFRLEQGAHQLYMSSIRATGVKESNRRIHRETWPAYSPLPALVGLPVLLDPQGASRM